MTELQTILIGVLANVVGDQVLVMLLTGLLHVFGRQAASKVLNDEEEGIAAPDDVMETPSTEGLSALES